MSALPIAIPLHRVSDVEVRDTLLRFERGLPVDDSIVLEILRAAVDLLDEADAVFTDCSHDLQDLGGLFREKEEERAKAVAEHAEMETERDEAKKETEELRKDLESDHAADLASFAQNMDEMRRRAEEAEEKVAVFEANANRAAAFWLAIARREASKEIVDACADYVERMACACLDGDATLALRAAAAGVRRDALQLPSARLDRSNPAPASPPCTCVPGIDDPECPTHHYEVPTRRSRRKKAV